MGLFASCCHELSLFPATAMQINSCRQCKIVATYGHMFHSDSATTSLFCVQANVFPRNGNLYLSIGTSVWWKEDLKGNNDALADSIDNWPLIFKDGWSKVTAVTVKIDCANEPIKLQGGRVFFVILKPFVCSQPFAWCQDRSFPHVGSNGVLCILTDRASSCRGRAIIQQR